MCDLTADAQLCEHEQHISNVCNKYRSGESVRRYSCREAQDNWFEGLAGPCLPIIFESQRIDGVDKLVRKEFFPVMYEGAPSDSWVQVVLNIQSSADNSTFLKESFIKHLIYDFNQALADTRTELLLYKQDTVQTCSLFNLLPA